MVCLKLTLVVIVRRETLSPPLQGGTAPKSALQWGSEGRGGQRDTKRRVVGSFRGDKSGNTKALKRVGLIQSRTEDRMSELLCRKTITLNSPGQRNSPGKCPHYILHNGLKSRVS